MVGADIFSSGILLRNHGSQQVYGGPWNFNHRHTNRNLADYAEPDGADVEMPEDDSIEPLRAEIDLGAILEESLALNLPAYPRKEGTEAGQMAFTEPGKTPLTDEDVKPFAGLADLRDKLAGKD